MPCTKCDNGKWKWGENGECKYDSKAACEKANPKNYKNLKTTSIVELVIADESPELTIDAISLVTSPAIEENFVFFGKEKNNLTFAKIDEEKRMLVSPALIPNKNIFRHNPNTMEDYYVYFSKETVAEAASLYLKYNNHHKATYQHEEDVSGILTVESWIKEGDQDKSNLYGYNLPIGTWFVKMKINNDEIWNKIKDGELKGLSIEGYFINKMEKMAKIQPTTEQILSAFNELVREGKITTMSKAKRLELGLADDVAKLTQQAKDLITDLDKDIKGIKELEKSELKAYKEVDKKTTAYEKAEGKYYELRNKMEKAEDVYKTLGREADEAIKYLDGTLKNIDILEKRLNKTKTKASKTRTNLEKKLNNLEKAAKDLGVKIPTGDASKVLNKLISLL